MADGIEIRGAREAQRAMEQAARDLHGDEMVQAMRESVLMVSRDAKRYATVDSGQMRASITEEVRLEGTTVVGVSGSNVRHSPFQELGTRPHWPPLAALETWARRHGTSAFVVARAIARRGTKAVRFLQRAVTENAGAIYTRLQSAVQQIVDRANRG